MLVPGETASCGGESAWKFVGDDDKPTKEFFVRRSGHPVSIEITMLVGGALGLREYEQVYEAVKAQAHGRPVLWTPVQRIAKSVGNDE